MLAEFSSDQIICNFQHSNFIELILQTAHTDHGNSYQKLASNDPFRLLKYIFSILKASVIIHHNFLLLRLHIMLYWRQSKRWSMERVWDCVSWLSRRLYTTENHSRSSSSLSILFITIYFTNRAVCNHFRCRDSPFLDWSANSLETPRF